MGTFQIRNSQSLSAVERAARTVATAKKPDRGTRHFLVLIAMIVVAGSTLVGYARAERQYEHPTLFDSWQNAYAVFDCRTNVWLEPFEQVSNPNGIRTRMDGVIYIEPSVESATGDHAQLGLFLDNVGATIDDTRLTLPGGSTLDEDGAWCNDEEAVLQVMRWTTPHSDHGAVELRTEDLSATPFLGDQEAFVIALAPLGSTLPPPPSIAKLTQTLESSPS